MYAVVEWVDEDPRQVSVVPKSWLDANKTRSFWPPNDVAKKIKTKDFASLSLPTPTTDWSQHNILCLRLEGKLSYVKLDFCKFNSGIMSSQVCTYICQMLYTRTSL